MMKAEEAWEERKNAEEGPDKWSYLGESKQRARPAVAGNSYQSNIIYNIRWQQKTGRGWKPWLSEAREGRKELSLSRRRN